MLVTEITNILKLSPTHFVSNIRHQHRCDPTDHIGSSQNPTCGRVLINAPADTINPPMASQNGRCILLPKIDVTMSPIIDAAL